MGRAVELGFGRPVMAALTGAGATECGAGLVRCGQAVKAGAAPGGRQLGPGPTRGIKIVRKRRIARATPGTGSLGHFQANLYLAEHSRLGIVVGALTSAAAAWAALDRVAKRCRIRVILMQSYRRDEVRRRRILTAWSFPDASHLAVMPGERYPATFEAIAPSGLSSCVMRDTAAAVRNALAAPNGGCLVHVYVELHGGLPELSHELLQCALMSQSRRVRAAAITGLRTSVPFPCRPG